MGFTLTLQVRVQPKQLQVLPSKLHFSKSTHNLRYALDFQNKKMLSSGFTLFHYLHHVIVSWVCVTAFVSVKPLVIFNETLGQFPVVFVAASVGNETLGHLQLCSWRVKQVFNAKTCFLTLPELGRTINSVKFKTYVFLQ